MSAFDDIEENIRLREQKLKARELEMRLKEIEQELDKIPTRETTPYVDASPVKKKKGRLTRDAASIGKFCLIVIGTIALVQVAAWVRTTLIVGGVAWMVYKLFIESD